MNHKKLSSFISSLSLIGLVTSCGGLPMKHKEKRNIANLGLWPKMESPLKIDPKMESEIESLLSKMTLEEKIGQMTQAEIKHVSPEEITRYHLGSILNGGESWPQNKKESSVSEWLDYATVLYNASIDKSQGGQGIPLLWGKDAVHGNSNLKGATIYPHNIGLGATRNPELIKKIGEATAKEVAVTGIDWTFAPTVAVVRDDRWGRSYEGYSEDPEIVKKYAEAMVEGLQGKVNTKEFLSDAHIIATAKHFIGDGGTFDGINTGDNRASEEELYSIHAQGYVQALKAGVQTVMASYNSWQGEKMHGQEYLLTDILKNQMGFDGFVISDWNGIGEVKGCTNDHCPQAINAGVDMIMVPQDWKKFISNTVQDVKDGHISENRINDAVRRILRVKMRTGFMNTPPNKRLLANKSSLVGSNEHRELARQAVRESLVLLKNKNNILPLDPKKKILLIGDGGYNISKQCGGWSVNWQGTELTNADFPGATAIYKGIENEVKDAGGEIVKSLDGSFDGAFDVAIFVYGENPYAESKGDIKNLEYQFESKADLKILKQLKEKGIPVISIFLSGRPLWVNKELNSSDAFIAAWLPGTEGEGVSDVIFKNKNGKIKNDFKGKLSFSWPKNSNQTALNRFDLNYDPLFSYGFGLSYADKDNLSEASQAAR